MIWIKGGDEGGVGSKKKRKLGRGGEGKGRVRGQDAGVGGLIDDAHSQSKEMQNG